MNPSVMSKILQTAEQIKVNFNEFPVGAGHIIIYENIGNNGNSAGASIM